MKLSSLGEFGLIDAIQRLSSRRSPGMLLGIGDDAAALMQSRGACLLVTADMLIEKIHFDLEYTDFSSLGWKSAAANLSDIAAMGGRPRFCLTSLGIPSHITVQHISDFYRGLNSLLRKHKTVLVGGDTCSSPGPFTISITLLGEADKKKIVTRAGARPGDRILVTNTLGDSGAGLEILKAGSRVRGPGAEEEDAKKLIKQHLRPVPRVEWGEKIVRSGCANSMIDLSDGLSSDLRHICKQSKTGALLYASHIPFSKPLLRSASVLKKPLLDYALSGGEDYELLFTVPGAKLKTFFRLGIPATEIGEITRSRGLFLVDDKNKKTPLQPTGYNHFAGAQP